MRNRVTITIKESLLENVDRLVDGLTIRSRSQAIEYLLSKTLKQYSVEGALILAGGRSVNGLPRPMLKVKGKPILEHIISDLKKNGVDNILVYIEESGEKIRDHFGDGNRFGVRIRYVIGEKMRGTAQPMMLAKEFFTETFLVIYGDTLCKIDYNDMIRVHRDNNSLFTIALTTVPNPQTYGVVKMNGNRITEFLEKPQMSRSYLVSSGIFLVEPQVLKHLSSKMNWLEKDLFPILAKKNLLIGYPFEGTWLNINNSKALRRANNVWY